MPRVYKTAAEWGDHIRRKQSVRPLQPERKASMRFVAGGPRTAKSLYQAACKRGALHTTDFEWHQYYRLGRYLPTVGVFIMQVAIQLLRTYTKKHKKQGRISVEVSGRRMGIPHLRQKQKLTRKQRATQARQQKRLRP